MVKKIDKMLKSKKIGTDGKRIKGIHAFFYNFSKAIDTTWPLECYLNYIKLEYVAVVFLVKVLFRNQKQVVKVGNAVWTPEETDGVPQGSSTIQSLH